jgi:hypothetical protein
MATPVPEVRQIVIARVEAEEWLGAEKGGNLNLGCVFPQPV